MPDSQNDLDFGRYRIQRLLGRGGMGEVYLARDTALERDVAIKFVSSQKLQDSAARARLLREAQAAAGLDHPCICPVHEAGVTEDGRAYIVMPFIDGTTLADIIPLGPMPPREALNICSQVADALATAHRHGIVHRDLKPGNIMMTTSGRPRLLDFGIAQTSLVPHVVAEATTVTVGPATSGGLVGTPAYMSPEQVQHRQVDGRSDLFALGVVLYECLTGARAFDGPTPYEAVANVLRVDPPPPSGRVPGLDGRHDALCARLMAKDPNDRFQSAEEVVGAIRVLLPDTGRITGTGTQPILAAASNDHQARGERGCAGRGCLRRGLWPLALVTGNGTAARASRGRPVVSSAGQKCCATAHSRAPGSRCSTPWTSSRSTRSRMRGWPRPTRNWTTSAQRRRTCCASRRSCRTSRDSRPTTSFASAPSGRRCSGMWTSRSRHSRSWSTAIRRMQAHGSTSAGRRRPPGCADAARDAYEHAISADSEYAAAYLQLGSVEAWRST